MFVYTTSMESMMTNQVGDKVRMLRKERGLLQEELAKRAGVSDQTIRNVEAGRYQTKLETVRKIAGALGVSLGELLE